jgi:hypothetical protein
MLSVTIPMVACSHIVEPTAKFYRLLPGDNIDTVMRYLQAVAERAGCVFQRGGAMWGGHAADASLHAPRFLKV